MDCWGHEREREIDGQSLWRECSGLKPAHGKQQLCCYVFAIYRTFKLLNSLEIWENFLNTCLNNFVTELKLFLIECKLFQIHGIPVDRQQSICIFNSMSWFTEMRIIFFLWRHNIYATSYFHGNIDFKLQFSLH